MTQPLPSDETSHRSDAYPVHVGASPPQPVSSAVHADPNGVPFNIGAAFTWALSKFSSNAVGLVGGAVVHTLLQAVGPAVAIGGAFALSQRTTTIGRAGVEVVEVSLTPGSIVAIVLGVLVALALLAYSLSAYIGGVVDIANGALTSIGSFFTPRRYGSVVAATLILLVAVAIGSIVIVGGVIVVFLFWFTIPIIVDRGVGPLVAMKASAALVRANLGESLVTALLLGMV